MYGPTMQCFTRRLHGCWRYDTYDDTVVILTDDKRGFVLPMEIFHPIEEAKK